MSASVFMSMRLCPARPGGVSRQSAHQNRVGLVGKIECSFCGVRLSVKNLRCAGLGVEAPLLEAPHFLWTEALVDHQSPGRLLLLRSARGRGDLRAARVFHKA